MFVELAVAEPQDTPDGLSDHRPLSAVLRGDLFIIVLVFLPVFSMVFHIFSYPSINTEKNRNQCEKRKWSLSIAKHHAPVYVPYLNFTPFVHFSVFSAQRFVLQGYGFSKLLRDTIYEHALQSDKLSYVVNMISETYVEISNKYLMDRITCLGQLVALDPVKDASEIEKQRNDLLSGCNQAKEAISMRVRERQRVYHEQIKERVGKIEQELQAALPPRTPADAEESQATVKNTLDKMEKSDVNQFCWFVLSRSMPVY